MKIYIQILLLALMGTLASCAKGSQPGDEHASTPPSGSGSIYVVNPTFQDQYAQSITWQSLRGKSRVMAMVFTHCPAACPIITEEIKKAESMLPASAAGNVGFTLVSFDSKRDTAARLVEFYHEHGLDSNWTLLHGAPEDVRTIAGLLNVQYKEWPGGDFTHSDVIFVIDSAGNIVLRQEGIAPQNPQIVALAVTRLLPQR